MSSIYHTEPPTQGKVLIKTTFGDIDVELWSKEAPLACRNFIQLSLEGYYDNTIIHRIIKGFMVQMGDPTGTGTGGKSIWGRPFKDEIHGRLKFNHRGQVAMANENAPNTNQSQFFISLDACEWLDRKHTIFGKVTGNTIFNVLRVGDAEVGGDGGDRPIEELRVIGIEVLWNPFDDIVPRDLSKNKSNRGASSSAGDKTKSIKAVKDSKLLSFAGDGDEEEEGEGDFQFNVKMKSSHEAKGKKKKSSSSSNKVKDSNSFREEDATGHRSAVLSRYADASSSASAAPARPNSRWDSSNGHVEYNSAVSARADSEGSGEEQEGANAEADFDRMMRSQLVKQRQKEQDSQPANTSSSSWSAARPVATQEADEEDGGALLDTRSMQAAADGAHREGALRSSNDTYRKLKEDLLRSRRAVNVLTGVDAAKLQEESAHRELVTPLEQRRRKYLKRRAEHGDRNDETMDKLKRFTEAVRSTKQQQSKQADSSATTGTEEPAHYHGQVLEEDEMNVDPEREKRELQTWFVGKLKCKKHIDHQYRDGGGGSDGRDAADYLVLDPRTMERGNGRGDASQFRVERNHAGFLQPLLQFADGPHYTPHIILHCCCGTGRLALWCCYRRRVSAAGHYVPLSFSMADLIDKVTWLQEHDEMAQQIVRNAENFARSYLRLEDHFCYVALALHLISALENTTDVLDEFSPHLIHRNQHRVRRKRQ